MQAAQTKLETIKHWSFNTFKCTKQLISEKFGKGSKTVDLELETQIETLKDMQRKYANILRLARTLTSHFSQVVQTQRALGEAFAEQSQRNPELQEEFSYNCETQRNLVKNGEVLLGKESSLLFILKDLTTNPCLLLYFILVLFCFLTLYFVLRFTNNLPYVVLIQVP